MPDHVTLTEAGLRNALRDPRYWTPGPERAACAAWVTDGYKAMYNSGAAKGATVKVRRAYWTSSRVKGSETARRSISIPAA